jgi:act minimal PKS acyl carrier protein
MAEFTLEDLSSILLSCSGVDDAADLHGDAVVTPFAELGYDSLALLELASQIQRIYGLPMPDEAVENMETPAAAVAYVNMRMAEVAV